MADPASTPIQAKAPPPKNTAAPPVVSAFAGRAGRAGGRASRGLKTPENVPPTEQAPTEGS